MTQPRRIAAKTLAARIAQERSEQLGNSCVGYTVRFDTRMPTRRGEGTIVLCTAGILLKRLQTDPLLSDLTHIILDEVHERSVETDLALLILKQLIRDSRPDLRMILMSATLECGRLEEFFREDEIKVSIVADVEGTNYPIQQHYLEDVLAYIGGTPRHASPECHGYLQAMNEVAQGEAELRDDPMDLLKIEDNRLEEMPYEVMAALIQRLHMFKPPGAILCFMPGWEELCELESRLLLGSDAQVHVVHSTSPPGTAEAIFKPLPEGVRRRIILATNIAESSLTIPDVVYVVDGGKQKVNLWDPRHRLNALTMAWASAANRKQRMGRAGRVQPGEYWLMLNRSLVSQLPAATPPEMLRLGLEDVCLTVRATCGDRLGTIQEALSTALDAPGEEAVDEAVVRLTRLGALRPHDQSLTSLGAFLSKLPVSAQLGKLLAMGIMFKCLDPVLSIVAAVGSRPFRPARESHEKVALHRILQRYRDCHSDHILLHRMLLEWQGPRNTSETLLSGIRTAPIMSRPGYFGEWNSPVSQLGMKSIAEANRQLWRMLEQEVGTECMATVNENAGNECLVRFLLATCLYPDVGILPKATQNRLKFRKLDQVLIPGSSINHRLTSSVINQGRRSEDIPRLEDPNQRPSFYLYDELMDVGARLAIKSTAIDPVCFILLAEQLKRISAKEVSIDGWLAIQCGVEGQLDKLIELRFHYRHFIRFMLDHCLNRKPLTEQEQLLVNSFVQHLIMFLKQEDLLRRLIK